MDNLAIARVLAEIGDLLEIKNENPFKIRAYATPRRPWLTIPTGSRPCAG